MSEWQKADDGKYKKCNLCEWVAPLNEDGDCEFCAHTDLCEILVNHKQYNEFQISLARGIIQCFHILRGLKP